MIHVIKADRTQEPFSEEKVLASIRRARIPHQLQGEVLSYVKGKLYEGISTGEIYQYILQYFNTIQRPSSKARYSLKEAIMMLGPSGYPFEDFVSRLLEHHGYTTQVRQILSGKCVTHEIDVLARKDGRTIAVETKFHNSPGTRSEVQVALYTHARFEDIKVRNKVDEVWLVTNTKTTMDANTYALCAGMKVISWDYPMRGGLREMIEESQLHPVTLLTTLTHAQKMTLLDNHIVLCKDILDTPQVLDILYLNKYDQNKILTEVKEVSSLQ